MISEFPLFLFTTLAGLSAGTYAASVAFSSEEGRKRPWLLLACIVLLGAGLLGCLGHLGHPERFLNALANPGAGIAQEAYVAIAFGVLLLIDLALTWRKGSSPRIVGILGAVAAIALMAVMGGAYLANLGTPAWAAWPTVPLFLVGDLAMGLALYAVFGDGAYKRASFSWTVVVMDTLLAVTLGFTAAHFASLGFNAAPFLVALAVACVGGIALAFFARTKEGLALPATAFACVLVGVCVARWFFYAASIV